MLQAPPHPVGLTFVVTSCLYVLCNLCLFIDFSKLKLTSKILLYLLLAKLYFTNCGSCNGLSSIVLCIFTSFRKFAFNRQCVCFVPQIRSLGELPFSLPDDVLKYKTTHNINIDQLTELNFKEDHYTTPILNTLGSAKAFGISPSEETNEESLVQVE